METATFDPRLIIRDVISTLTKKPLLFVPMILPLFVSVISDVGWRAIFHFYGYDERILGLEDGIIYLVMGWNMLIAMLGVLIGLISSAWAIKTYHIHHIKRRIELFNGFKCGIRFLRKIILARLVVFLMLLVPLTIPLFIVNFLTARSLGPENYGTWIHVYPHIPLLLISLFVMVFFSFINQAIIIEGSGVISSIKRSYRIGKANYIQTLAIIVLPTLLTVPFYFIDILMEKIGFYNPLINNLLESWGPGILGFFGSAVVVYSLTNGFLVSAKGGRKGTAARD